MLIAIREECWGAPGRGVEGLFRKEIKSCIGLCVSSGPDLTLTWELGGWWQAESDSYFTEHQLFLLFLLFFFSPLWTVNLGWIRSKKPTAAMSLTATSLPNGLAQGEMLCPWPAWQLLPGISLWAKGLLASPLNSKEPKTIIAYLYLALRKHTPCINCFRKHRQRTRNEPSLILNTCPEMP